MQVLNCHTAIIFISSVTNNFISVEENLSSEMLNNNVLFSESGKAAQCRIDPRQTVAADTGTIRLLFSV